MAVTYGLADFATGDHIVDLPVMEGASWAVMLNRPDSVSCEVDLRDPDVRALDIPSVTEPKKMVLFAATDDGSILAWGPVSSRKWNDDERTVAVEASGGWQYFNQRIIAPAAAATGTIILPDGKVSAAFDTKITGTTLGGIGIELVRQALTWPGAPTAFVIPAKPVGTRESDTYRLVDYKGVGSALTDLTKRQDGPDFAFEARRDATGLALEYVMRVGAPYLGTEVGSWPTGSNGSPVFGLTVDDDGAEISTHTWMQSGRTDSKVLVARQINDTLLAAGYPVLDLVDTSHTDVTQQATLDAYAVENRERASSVDRVYSFSVKGSAGVGPQLGQYRPGDFAALDVGAGNFYLTEGLHPIRITGISGDETGEDIKIQCEVVS